MPSLSLCSAAWHFRDPRSSSWDPATVPGCVHTDLLRARKIPDPFWGTNETELQWIEERDWEYRARFDVPADLASEDNIDLVADGLDTVATVTLNGRELLRTDNMFTGYRRPVRAYLRPKANELVIRFHSAMDYIRTHRVGHRPREYNDRVGRCQVIRKQQCQFGWDWGPRFVTAGIWRDLRLEGWSGNRLDSVRVTQNHQSDGSVTLTLAPELAHPDASAQCHWRLTLDQLPIAEGHGRTLHVQHPQLWWPQGQGAQPLYTLEVAVTDAKGSPLGSWIRRLGLRTLRLDRSRDAAGEAFQFVVNGRPIFAKGANWIPAHSFVAGLKRKDYARDLRAAADANMNMLRVWGGGIYESEDFYDLCDELGLLVWQDFMFACSLYPADRAFLASVRAEAEYQVKRLRHRTCLALWCGNNEIEQLNEDLLENPRQRKAYTALFHTLLPDVVQHEDGITAYWPSSPYRGDGDNSPEAGEQRGDTHFWGVWHNRAPVKDYEKWRFRFVSEFGMQSYSSPATQMTFCPPDDANVFGPILENHQKNIGGNQVILDYVSRRYRFPKSQDDLIYLSQLNQAYCMQTGVEHYRRQMPHCMGALYWQLNDCWPVASWSSIEHTGHWKALHHLARRFFAPVLVTAHLPGEETAGIGNTRRFEINEVHLYTVSDSPAAHRAWLRWELLHLDGQKLVQQKKAVTIRYAQSVRQKTLSLGRLLKQHGRDQLVLRISLEVDGTIISEESVFFAPPRFLNLRRGKTAVALTMKTTTEAEVVITSSVFQHRFALEFTGLSPRFSDNFIELFPNEPKRLTITFPLPVTRARLESLLRFRSLVDTYEENC